MKHEQAVADNFNRFLGRQASSFGKKIHTIALDGQDRDAGDYLLTDEDRFALIEFKSTEQDIKHESRKGRRLQLCELLEFNAKMKALHDQCHFIVWMQSSGVQLNVYRYEVCNQEVFGGGCGLACKTASVGSRVHANQFAADLFGAPASRTLSLSEFEDYLAWLMVQASGGTRGTLELLIEDGSANELRLVQFESVRAAHDWFLTKRLGS